jgi:hypothetical protein
MTAPLAAWPRTVVRTGALYLGRRGRRPMTKQSKALLAKVEIEFGPLPESLDELRLLLDENEKRIRESLGVPAELLPRWNHQGLTVEGARRIVEAQHRLLARLAEMEPFKR